MGKLFVIGVAVAGLIGCSSSSPDSDPPDGGNDADATIPQPGDYLDPLERDAVLDRGAGSTVHPAEMVFRDDGMLLYCGTPGGLFAVDASDPANPRRLGRLRPNNQNRCQHLSIDGDRVYAASRGDESADPSVSAFDFSVTPPAQLPSFTRSDLSYEGVAAAGDLAYVAVHEAGVLVLDWSSGAPTEVTLLGNGFDNAWAVAVRGTTLWVADAGSGLIAVDVANPQSPAIVGSVAIPTGSAQALVLGDSHAYVGIGSGGVAVVDISEPTAPALVATVDTPGSATDLSLTGDLLLIADWSDFRVLDVTDPTAPAVIATETVIDSNREFTRFLGAAALGTTMVAGEFNGSIYFYTLSPERVAPDIWTKETTIAFQRTAAGETDAYALIVRNEGTADLVATSIAVDDAAFSTTASTLAIAPGGAAVVEVFYHPSSDSEDRGSLTFESDDPDEAPLVVDLVGNAPTLQVGDPAPEVELGLLGGGSWRSTDERGQVLVLAYFATF